ncbi:unnamed protein product [Trichogramma brassicae]|uniref:Integrase catalytic domain-containing protein n=1 Tax=Trichogramma brassicae TaxID=86971 RepID=A0A6H5J4V3_9HYME|nr:unnamed protein product [Trichogramma brassicae]
MKIRPANEHARRLISRTKRRYGSKMYSRINVCSRPFRSRSRSFLSEPDGHFQSRSFESRSRSRIPEHEGSFQPPPPSGSHTHSRSRIPEHDGHHQFQRSGSRSRSRSRISERVGSFQAPPSGSRILEHDGHHQFQRSGLRSRSRSRISEHEGPLQPPCPRSRSRSRSRISEREVSFQPSPSGLRISEHDDHHQFQRSGLRSCTRRRISEHEGPLQPLRPRSRSQFRSTHSTREGRRSAQSRGQFLSQVQNINVNAWRSGTRHRFTCPDNQARPKTYTRVQVVRTARTRDIRRYLFTLARVVHQGTRTCDVRRDNLTPDATSRDSGTTSMWSSQRPKTISPCCSHSRGLQERIDHMPYTCDINYCMKQLNACDVDEVISDTAVMAKILGGLPEKYGAFIVAWDSVETNRQTLSTLKERLLKEEKRLSVDSADNIEAFSSTMTGNSRRYSNGNNHVSDGRLRTHKNNNQRECHYCHRKGHLARECFKKANDRERAQRQQNKPANSRSQSNRYQSNSNLTAASFSGAFLATADEETSNVEANSISTVGQRLIGTDVTGVWMCDSGASCHITFRREWFAEYRKIMPKSITQSDNNAKLAVGIGTILIKRYVNGKWLDGRLDNVLHVPKFRRNLFSTNVLTSKGLRVVFDGNFMEVIHKDSGEVMAEGEKFHANICCLYFRVIAPEANIGNCTLQDLHRTLGHVNAGSLKKMIKNDSIDGVSRVIDRKFFCESCQYGKMHRLPYKYHEKSEDQFDVGQCIYTDLCGPMSVSLGGAKFFMLLKDRKSGFRYVYFLKKKSESLHYFKKFYHLIAAMDKRIKRLRCDNGTEFCNEAFRSFLSEKGIQLCTSAPYCPEQNGRIERENRTIVESARTMLLENPLPRNLWAEAVNTAVYTLNRTISANNNKITPYEQWCKKKPSVKHMYPFGTTAFVHVPSMGRTKFDSKARKTVLVGYHDECNDNYRLYDLENRKIIVSRDVKFRIESDEVDIAFKIDKPRPSHEEESAIEVQEDEANVDDKQLDHIEGDYDQSERVEIDSTIDEPRIVVDKQEPATAKERKKRKISETSICDRTLRDRLTLKRPKWYGEVHAALVEPLSLNEALNCPKKDEWMAAIEEELASHKKNETWNIINRPEGIQVLDTKWVFKTQLNTDGTVRRYKARLCARGFKQRAGIDYEETYAPVVKYESLRILFAIAAHEDLEMVQFDVKTAFLYGILEEDIYITLPQGLHESHGENQVCKLKKSLYGLKQASRCWNKKFTDFLNEFGFEKCTSEWSVLPHLLILQSKDKNFGVLFDIRSCPHINRWMSYLLFATGLRDVIILVYIGFLIYVYECSVFVCDPRVAIRRSSCPGRRRPIVTRLPGRPWRRERTLWLARNNRYSSSNSTNTAVHIGSCRSSTMSQRVYSKLALTTGPISPLEVIDQCKITTFRPTQRLFRRAVPRAVPNLTFLHDLRSVLVIVKVTVNYLNEGDLFSIISITDSIIEIITMLGMSQ